MKTFYVTVVVVILAWTAVASGQEPRRDRFFGTLKIGNYIAVASPFDGGTGGFPTSPSPIYADVVIMVEEGQSLTWEWIGIRPDATSKEGLPNITLDVGASRAEFTDLVVDLNPNNSPNIWSGPSSFLQYDRLNVEGSYSSFSFQATFSEVFRPDDSSPHGFLVAPMLDYARFPDELTAQVASEYCGSAWCDRVDDVNRNWTLLPRNQVVLEPKLALGRLLTRGQQAIPTRLTFTPTGDANNDGTVGFDDFLILSGRFGAEGEWEDGDFDFDGFVGFSDFLGLSANFGKSGNAPVPEPSTVLLAIFGILGLLGFRYGSPCPANVR